MREELSGFRHCGQETTGNTIKELIANLTMDNFRGQSNDGAGNMAGRYTDA